MGELVSRPARARPARAARARARRWCSPHRSRRGAADDSFTVDAAGLRPAGRRADHRPGPRQRVGPRLRADDAVVGRPTTAPTSRRCTAAPTGEAGARRHGARRPTGTVFNSTAGFLLPSGGKALFLFDTEDGLVRGWNGAQGTTAIVVADRSDVGAIYKGLAIADTRGGPAPLRGRLPQPTDRRLRRQLHAGAEQRLRRPGAAEAASRRSTSR